MKDFKQVDSWVDIVSQEHEILRFWDEKNIFNRLREKNKNGEPFSFLDGPMTANNPMGVHHAWGRSLKDAFQRYFAMNGRQLRYQNGFDCQGLWVEVEVEKELNLGSKKAVREYGIDKFVEACKERVRKYSGVQRDQSIRLGMWMDWDNSYFTMSEENNYTIWSFLKKCFEQGKIYRGTDVMPWSGRSGSAYSQMEVIEGRKLVAHPSLFVKFPLIEREGENLLVWTTTPWTLSSNVAAAVNAELDYVCIRAKHDNELYYFAEENLNFKRLEKQYKEKHWVDGVPKLKTLAQIFNERGGFEIVRTLKGSELVGLRYRGPFDELEAQHVKGGFPFTDENIDISCAEAHRVIDGGRDSHGEAVVVAGEGTGIVHIAPGCGDVDHKLGVALSLPMIAPLDEASNFIEKFGYLTGCNATSKETRERIIEDLKNKGVLVAQELYPHIYPHCWRTGDELVFRMVDEWYIRMDWRDKIIDCAKSAQWIPSFGKDREVDWLTNMHDWMISKKRYWGLALPIWVCEDCKNFEVIGSREELKEKAIEGWDKFEGHTPHKPWIDEVKIACPHCKGKCHRVEDVGNPWLDAGIVPYSTVHYNSDREYWKKWMPADLVLECFPGQFRNWFYSLLAMSTMMENIAPFKTLLGHALVRDEHGKEMHKSTGNAIWFDDAAEQAGADVMRWLYARQATDTNLNFGFGPLRDVRGGFINTLWNIYAFFVNYARLEHWTPKKDTEKHGDKPLFDRWILSELQKCIQIVRQGFETYDIRSAALAVEDFVEDLSNWYLRHNRKRFWKTEDDPTLRSDAAFDTLYQCLLTLSRMIAPILPFLSESIYRNLSSVVENAPESVHLTDYPTVCEDFIDEDLNARMKSIMAFTNLALSARDAQKLKLRQPLALMTVGTADAVDFEAANAFESMIREDLNVKAVKILEPGTPSPLDYEIKLNFRACGPKFGKAIKDVSKAINDNHAEMLKFMRSDAETFEFPDLNLSIGRDDLIMNALPNPDLAIAEEAGRWVAIDTHITEDLKLEGLMRDFLRRFQVARKDGGLNVEDRITLTWHSDSEIVRQMFDVWGESIAQDLLAVNVRSQHALDQVVEIEGEKLTFKIEVR